MLIGYNHAAVSTQMVGSYNSADTCHVIANQLRQKSAPYDDDTYYHYKEVQARCVQVKG